MASKNGNYCFFYKKKSKFTVTFLKFNQMKKIYFLVISLLFAFQIVAPSRLYAQCLAPTQLSVSVNTQNSVTISWAASNSLSYYNVQYQTPNNPNWVILNNVSSPLTLTGLNCGGVYICQVQQVCPQTATSNPLLSDWSNITFTTLPCANPCGAPTALTATNMSQNGAVLNWTGNSSATSLYNIRYHSGNLTTWTTLPNVTMPYQLGNLPCGTGFEWQVQQICNTTPGTLSGVSPWSIGSTFNTLACPNPCVTPSGSATTNISQTSAVLNWNPNIIATPSIYNIRYHSANSTTWIVANNVSAPYQLNNLQCGTGYVWQVHQVCSSVNEPSPWSTGTTFSTLACLNICEVPSGLTTTSINQTSAVLNWNPNSTTTSLYNLQYHSATSTAWIPISNVTMPYTLANLACGTGYAWRVQRICNNNPAGTAPALSLWSIPMTFSTLACPNPCVAPIGLASTNITQTGVALSWGPNTTSNNLFNIRYHSGNSTAWIVINNVSSPYQLGNLLCGTGFEWQVQQVCGPSSGTLSGVSPWSVGATFSTLVCPNPCAAPTQISVAFSIQNSAVITWATPNTSMHYNVQYHVDGNPNWIILNNVSSPLTLTGLNCGAVYIFQVQQVCSNSVGAAMLSPWSTVTFTTPPCQSPCVAPIELHSTNISQNGAVLHWGLATTIGVYNIRYHSANSTNWITLNNVSLPYQLGNLPCGTGFEWQVQQVCTNSPTPNALLSPWSVGATFSTLACPNPCVAPIGLTATNSSQTSVVLHWGPTTVTGTGNVFNIRYHSANSTAWITLNNVSMPYQLGNLPCATGFEWQVQRVCGPSSGTFSALSPWSVGATFSTLVCTNPNPCVAPIGLSTTNTNQNSAVLHWGPVTAPATNLFNIRYHIGNSTTWIVVNNVSSPYQLGNLSCSAGYVWQVQRICGTASGSNSELSPWSLPSTFSTTPCMIPCAAPTELGANDITQTSAILHWGVVPGAVAYIVSYKPVNNTTSFITVTTNSNTTTINGLTASTSYTYQVKAICANGTIATNLSPLSAPYLFATPAALVIYPNPANEILRMSYLLSQGSVVTIQLRDSFGQLVVSVNEIAVEGSNEFKVNTVGISEGIYFLTVITNSDSITSKVYIKH